MEIKDLRYIVFLLTTDTAQYMSDGRRIDTHDGEIFTSLPDAKEYAMDAVQQQLCNRFVIGVFKLEPQYERMGITSIETYGFRNDKKNVAQLDLFT